MAESPNLIESPDTENTLSPLLISGGKSLIPICLQDSMYSATFDELSMTELMVAAINSFG